MVDYPSSILNDILFTMFSTIFISPLKNKFYDFLNKHVEHISMYEA